MSNLAQRFITALLGVSIIVFSLIYSHWTFGFIILLTSVFTLNEFYKIAKENGYYPFSFWGSVFNLSLFILVFLICKGEIQSEVLWVLPPLLMVSFLFTLYSKPPVHPINCLAVTLMGLVYIALPFTLLNVIAFRTGDYEFAIILGILLAQWSSDTGAYFIGKQWGKTKLFKSVSPNKTWEGAIGGVIFSLGSLYAWSIFFDQLNTMEWIGLGLIVAVSGVFGDLVESLFKRTLSIKDSGAILKGHGGFLDRFDGLIIAIPFSVSYLLLVV